MVSPATVAEAHTSASAASCQRNSPRSPSIAYSLPSSAVTSTCAALSEGVEWSGAPALNLQRSLPVRASIAVRYPASEFTYSSPFRRTGAPRTQPSTLVCHRDFSGFLHGRAGCPPLCRLSQSRVGQSPLDTCLNLATKSALCHQLGPSTR